MHPIRWIAGSKRLAQHVLLALAALGSATMGVAQSAVTQTTPEGLALWLASVEVRAVSRVEPGAELMVSLHATPGARVRLRIDGASQALRLTETAPGRYQGTYIVTARDRIGPRSQLTVKLRHDLGLHTARLGRPLQRDWTAPANEIAGARIDSVTVVAEPGRTDALRVELQGSPGGRVTLRLASPRQHTVWLQEARSGLYRALLLLPQGEPVDFDQALTLRLSTAQGSVLKTVHDAFRVLRPAGGSPARPAGTTRAVPQGGTPDLWVVNA